MCSALYPNGILRVQFGLLLFIVHRKFPHHIHPSGSVCLSHLGERPAEDIVEYIDYVITHELCHLKHLHHEMQFYKLLSRIMPGWEVKKKNWIDLILDNKNLFAWAKSTVSVRCWQITDPQ